MAISLSTGLPGAGKTLYTLSKVKARAELEGRDVYYMGIPDLALGWTELEGVHEIPMLPAGAIIVIDECQRHFSPRAPGAEVPEHLRYFETHRHKGHDVWLITQNPALIDKHLRELIEEHAHVVRSWGREKAVIWMWPECNKDPKSRRNENYAIKTKWEYPKEVYSWYRSSTMHTVQPAYPWREWLWPVFLGLVGFGGVGGGLWMLTATASDDAEQQPEAVKAVEHRPAPRQQAVSYPGAYKPTHRRMQEEPTAQKVAAMHTPLIDGIPGTAPLYMEQYARIADYPRVTGCVRGATKCTCYSQQGTVIEMQRTQCERYVRRTPFDHSREPRRAMESRLRRELEREMYGDSGTGTGK